MPVSGADRGAGAALDTEVAVTEACGGPWCGSLPNDVEAMTFLEITDDGYALSVGPCRSGLFAPVAPEEQKAMRACLAGQACAPAN